MLYFNFCTTTVLPILFVLGETGRGGLITDDLTDSIVSDERSMGCLLLSMGCTEKKLPPINMSY